MSAAIPSLPLSLSIIRVSSYFGPKIQNSLQSLHFPVPLTAPTSTSVSLRKTLDFHNRRLETRVLTKSVQIWRLSATTEEISAKVDIAQEAVSSASGDDGVSVIIQVLLFVAFAALSLLTLGVIYIGVTDFLQKREREKFEKEEVAKKSKKGGKKKAMRSKAGPRGFGQKTDDENDAFDV